jgi:hypothetical protein
MNNDLLIPEPIKSAVKAANDHDTNSFLSTFVETAVLTDEGQEYHGIEAIRKWSDEKLIGANVTFVIIDIKSSGDKTVVTAEVDGDFDKTGLPHPFIMALHFVAIGSKIKHLSFHLPDET